MKGEFDQYCKLENLTPEERMVVGRIGWFGDPNLRLEPKIPTPIEVYQKQRKNADIFEGMRNISDRASMAWDEENILVRKPLTAFEAICDQLPGTKREQIQGAFFLAIVGIAVATGFLTNHNVWERIGQPVTLMVLTTKDGGEIADIVTTTEKFRDRCHVDIERETERFRENK